MYRNLFLIVLINGLLTTSGISQSTADSKFRTIDGSFNNRLNPTWGSSGSNLIRLGKANYLDGIFQPFTSKITGRAVSNEIFAQDDIDIKDPSNLSDFCWVFGQFIDHEFGLTPNNTERFDIAVPPGDIWFDPASQNPLFEDMKEPNWSALLAIPEVRLHLYGKTQARRDRKMGHINCVADSLDKAMQAATQVRNILGTVT